MVVRIAERAMSVAFTGTIHPCISLFKPVSFDGDRRTAFNEHLFRSGVAAARRARGDAAWRRALRHSIEGSELPLFAALESGDISAAEKIAADWTGEWLSD
jgi:hypothetical protein